MMYKIAIEAPSEDMYLDENLLWSINYDQIGCITEMCYTKNMQLIIFYDHYSIFVCRQDKSKELKVIKKADNLNNVLM